MLKILLVENYDSAREIIALTLRDRGYVVVAAASLTEAIENLKSDPAIQVLLTALNLSKPLVGEGIALARVAKGLCAKIEVILVGDEPLLDDRQRREIREIGVRKIVAKPGLKGLEEELEVLQRVLY